MYLQKSTGRFIGCTQKGEFSSPWLTHFPVSIWVDPTMQCGFLLNYLFKILTAFWSVPLGLVEITLISWLCWEAWRRSRGSSFWQGNRCCLTKQVWILLPKSPGCSLVAKLTGTDNTLKTNLKQANKKPLTSVAGNKLFRILILNSCNDVRRYFIFFPSLKYVHKMI